MDGSREHHIEWGNQDPEKQIYAFTHKCLLDIKQRKTSLQFTIPENQDNKEDPKRVSGRRSAPGGGKNFPQRKVELDEDDDEDDDDDDFDDEEAEEKVPVKKSVRDTPAKNAQKSNQNGKDLKPSTPRSKGQESFKKQEKKNLKHQKDLVL